MKDAMMLSFPLAEYEHRVGNLLKNMVDAGVDACIFTSDENTFYLTGFQSIVWDSKVSTPAVIVITSDGDISLTTTSGGRETARVTSCVEDIRYTGVGGYPTLAKSIVSLLEEKKLLGKTIALELGMGHKMHLNYANQQALMAELSNAKIVDVAPLMWPIRSIKSPLEIERLKKSGEINCLSIEKGFRGIKEDVTTEKELYRMISMECFRLGAERMLPLGVRAGAERYSQGNCMPSHRPIHRGEMILVDGGPCYEGYFTDIIRQAMIGQPTPHQLDLFNVAREAAYVGLSKVKPGEPITVVQQAVKEFIDSTPYKDLYHHHSVGHSIGTGVHEYPMLDETTEVFKPGMTFAIEPAIYEEGVGSTGIEENFVVTETGYEIFTPLDSHLMIVEG